MTNFKNLKLRSTKNLETKIVYTITRLLGPKPKTNSSLKGPRPVTQTLDTQAEIRNRKNNRKRRTNGSYFPASTVDS